MPSSPLYYADYLKLDQLLTAQKPISDAMGKPVHDEMMFVIVHQVFELWFKQILIELDSVTEIFNHGLPESSLSTAITRLKRVCEIQTALLKQIDVLKTMTPMDFLEFRDLLTPASGFQSLQFRLIETRLGLVRDDEPFLKALNEEDEKTIEKAKQQTSLFQCVDQWLSHLKLFDDNEGLFWERFQFVVDDMLMNDERIITNNPLLSDEKRQKQLEKLDATRDNFSAIFNPSHYQSLQNDGQVGLSFDSFRAALFVFLYRDKPHLFEAYQLLSTLIDLDEVFSRWRYLHALLVQRMIGTRIGTGGSSGLEYLKATADSNRVFSDLTNLSTFLIPRSTLPDV